MNLTLPYPPSANRYWRVWNGRAVKSEEARNYQTAARLVGLQQKAKQGVRGLESGPVKVLIRVYRPAKRGDLDNALKVLFDAMAGVAYLDDSQVVEIRALRFESKSNPRVEIEVERAETEAGAA